MAGTLVSDKFYSTAKTIVESYLLVQCPKPRDPFTRLLLVSEWPDIILF